MNPLKRRRNSCYIAMTIPPNPINSENEGIESATPKGPCKSLQKWRNGKTRESRIKFHQNTRGIYVAFPQKPMETQAESKDTRIDGATPKTRCKSGKKYLKTGESRIKLHEDTIGLHVTFPHKSSWKPIPNPKVQEWIVQP